MKLKINLRKGNNPNVITVTVQVLPEVTIEIEGEAHELLPFFDRLREDGITQVMMDGG